MLHTELEVKFGCTQTVRDMPLNPFRLFQDPLKRRNPQSVIKTNNKCIYRVMTKLQEIYFPYSFLFKTSIKVKFRTDADNGKNPISHEEQEAYQYQEPESDEEKEEHFVVNMDAPRLSDFRKIVVTYLVTLAEPATNTKSIWNKKRNIGTKYFSKAN